MFCIQHETLPFLPDRPALNQTAAPPLSFGPSLDEVEFRRIESRLALDFCKWDCQVGDVSTLFRQPLLIDSAVWEELESLAEALAAELMVAENEVLHHPDFHARLGMPPQLRSVLKEAATQGLTPAAVRTLRFDFHYTTDGWRISEVNCDVPGGYTEASVFTKLVADCVPCANPAGNPAAQLANAMTSVVGEGGTVALLSAVGFLEDQQVTAFLASQLQQHGIETVLLHHSEQLTWKSGRASAIARGKHVDLGAIVRFYQGEWLARSENRNSWKWLFAGGKTPVTNPGSALLTESKRFPLTWDDLSIEMSTWRRLLPESRDPRDTVWQMGDDWVLKLAFSNTGDEVHVRELMNEQGWNRLCRTVRKNPSQWIAQKRFQPVAVASAVGPVYPCIGIYVIDGRAAGVYARVSIRSVIDYAAMDVALLIREDANVE